MYRDYRKSGVASALIDEMLRCLESIPARYLVTYTCSLPEYDAICRLFERNGLREVGRLPPRKRFRTGRSWSSAGRGMLACYVIVEGSLELTSVSAAGWEGTLGVLGPGEVCGANSALDGRRPPFRACVFWGVKALVLEREDVTRLVRLHPEIGIGLLRAPLARIRLLKEMMMRFDL